MIMQSPPADALDDGPLESVSFHGLKGGPKLIVLGAVHGNEGCGRAAINRIITECRSGALSVLRGEVTFVPVANPKARRQNTREGDRNLNRDMRERPQPGDNEDRIGYRLCALLRQHDVLLDVHSFKREGEPFVFFGPENNTDDLEAFRHADAEASFAACLGTGMLIHGWLDIYVSLIAARERLNLPRLAVTEGFGTTEFRRFAGGYGVTLECGRHDDPASIDVSYAAIRNALGHLGLVDAPTPALPRPGVIHMSDLVICEEDGDRVEVSWKTGDAIAAGLPIARGANGDVLLAPRDGFAIFPNKTLKPGEAIIYLGEASSRRV